MKPESQYELSADRRKYPRLVLGIPVELHLDNENSVCAHLQDLSPDGLQIRCDKATADQVHSCSKRNQHANRPSILVDFKLPGRGDGIKIVVRCTICYLGPLPVGSDWDIAIGMQFLQFAGDSLEQIKDFFMGEMEPG